MKTLTQIFILSLLPLFMVAQVKTVESAKAKKAMPDKSTTEVTNDDRDDGMCCDVRTTLYAKTAGSLGGKSVWYIPVEVKATSKSTETRIMHEAVANPLSVLSKSKIKTHDVTVCTEDGMDCKVFSAKIEDGLLKLPVLALSSGNYYVQVNDGDRVVRSGIMVK